MAISEVREQIYIDENEDIYCYSCSDLLDPETAFTCEECQQDFCEECINNHEC